VKLLAAIANLLYFANADIFLKNVSNSTKMLDMFQHCNSRADFLNKVNEYQNILAPNEFIKLYQEFNTILPDIAERQMARTVDMINSLGKEYQNFIRKPLSPNVNFYSAPLGMSSKKKLLICFCGIANRLLVPIPVFLQTVPQKDFDVLVYSDPDKTSYLNGIPEFSRSLKDLMSNTKPYVDFQRYTALISIGTSGGGSAALYFGILANIDKAISVCGKHRSLAVKKPSNIELLKFDGFEFDRMIKNHLDKSKTKTILVYGEKCPRDIYGALSLKKHLPLSQELIIKDLAEHNAFHYFLARGKLKAFIQMLLKV
jgi:hypothetical protein